MTKLEMAVVHEHHPQRGGGERVAEHIAETLDSPLYTGYATEEGRPSNLSVEFHELFDDAWFLPLLRREYPFKFAVRDGIYIWAWEHLPELREYDVLIQSGNNPGWYVPEDDQVTLKYVHSTPRTPYDLFHENGTGLPARLYSKAVRTAYEQNLSYPDLYVANSDVVARRINQYWGIDDDHIRVIYPPVDTDAYTPQPGTPGRFVTVSRLTPEKRIASIVKTFQGSDFKLDIAGRGPEEDRVRELAAGHENITIHGWVSEDEKRHLLQSAEAFVFAAKNEDFGIAPIEAMAAGTPVVGVGEGFTVQQIVDGCNGYTYAHEGGHLRETIRYIHRNGVDWAPRQIAAFARENFGFDRWHTDLRDAVVEARDNAAIQPDFTLPEDDDHSTAGRIEQSVADGGVGGDSR